MNILLDTHTFYWFDQETDRLSAKAEAYIRDGSNTIFLSVVNAWEMVIKVGIGKLRLDDPIPDIVARQVGTNGFHVLPVTLAHVYGLAALPDHHKDPFDRLLIAQAITDDLVLLSADAVLTKYPVRVEW